MNLSLFSTITHYFILKRRFKRRLCCCFLMFMSYLQPFHVQNNLYFSIKAILDFVAALCFVAWG